MSKLKIRQPTCPWWFLFTFDNPLRKLYQDPVKILTPFIKDGDTVVDLGCGMGYFSLPMGRMVGEAGKVISVDLQPQMLSGLKYRAKRLYLLDRVQTHLCQQDQIGVQGPVDFALAFWMVHEVHDQKSFLEQIQVMLKPRGVLLIAEPYLHVSRIRFEQTVSELEELGFRLARTPQIGFSRSILAIKGE